jgi:hypothetical protein
MMSKEIFVVFFMLSTLCLVSTSAIVTPAHAQGTTIFVDPTPKNAVVGTDFTVNVNASNVAGYGLAGWNFNMTFDPTIIQCVSVAVGSFLPQPINLAGPWIDNTHGWVAAGAYHSGLIGVSGSGTLAVITFHCLGSGDTNLHFVLGYPETILIDTFGNQMPFTAIDGHVHQYTAAPPSVGGVGVAANVIGLVATWMTVVSLVAVTTVSIGYVKRRNKQQN